MRSDERRRQKMGVDIAYADAEQLALMDHRKNVAMRRDDSASKQRYRSQNTRPVREVSQRDLSEHKRMDQDPFPSEQLGKFSVGRAKMIDPYG